MGWLQLGGEQMAACRREVLLCLCGEAGGCLVTAVVEHQISPAHAHVGNKLSTCTSRCIADGRCILETGQLALPIAPGEHMQLRLTLT